MLISYIKILKNHLYSNVKTRGNYDSFIEALSKSRSYNDVELAEYVYRKTKHYAKKLKKQKLLNPSYDFLMLICIVLATRRRKVNIVDFGGGAGKHYYEANSFFSDYDISFSWNIIETETMCSICKNIESEELKYFKNLDSFISHNKNKVDIVFSDSVLPFLRDPYDTLEDILTLNPDYLLLSRIHTSPKAEILAVQTSRFDVNGPNVSDFPKDDRIASYPIRILNSPKIESIITKCYDIMFCFRWNWTN